MIINQVEDLIITITALQNRLSELKEIRDESKNDNTPKEFTQITKDEITRVEKLLKVVEKEHIDIVNKKLKELCKELPESE